MLESLKLLLFLLGTLLAAIGAGMLGGPGAVLLAIGAALAVLAVAARG